MAARPELKAKFEQTCRDAEAAAAVEAKIAGLDAAAALFQGSTDTAELELKHSALLRAGALLRAAGQREHAVRRFAALAQMARTDAGPNADACLLAHYQLGLLQQQGGDLTAAAKELALALEGFERKSGATRHQALIGAALGLVHLQAGAYPDATRVLERARRALESLGGEEASMAAVLHNLAVARVRGGSPAEGVEAAAAALRLRQKLNGAEHPYTIETALVEALGRVDLGDPVAAEQVRRAARVVLQGAGEAHAYFADALLVEARRLARLNDGPGAEGLARRALFLLEQAQVSAAASEHRLSDARALRALWRRGTAASNPDAVSVWHVQLQHTLRRYQPATLDFATSGDRPKDWFLFVPSAWTLDQATYAAQVVFADLGAALSAREPADANILDATSASARLMGASELSAMALETAFRARTWEPSAAYSVVLGSSSRPLAPQAFAQALAALFPSAPSSTFSAFGLDAAAVATARADRSAALRAALF